MLKISKSAVVTKRDQQYHVNTSRAHRGSFKSLADAQLWAITITTREADIEAAVMLSGLVIQSDL